MLLSISLTAFGAANFDDDGNRDEETGLDNNIPDDVVVIDRPVHELDNPDDEYRPDEDIDEYVRIKNVYNETVAKLTALGIWTSLPAGEYTDKITRGEFSAIVCGLINMNRAIESDTKNYSYDSAVDTLAGMGNMDSGYEEKSSGSVITFKEAAEILVKTLGYKPFVTNGTSAEYISTAYGKKIIEHVSKEADEELSRLDTAYMMEDAIEADVYTYNDGRNYKNEGKALEYYHKAYERTGVLTSVYDTFISGGAVCGVNEITIDGMSFLYKGQNALSDLGYHIEAYYSLDNGDRTCIYYSRTDKNNTIRIEGQDIESYENNTLTYYNGSRKRTARLNKIKPILNYFEPDDSIDEQTILESDYVVLIDNSGDNKYDEMFVFNYDVMAVKRVSISNNMVFGMYNNEVLEVDFDSPDTYICDRTGAVADAYYITPDSVISYAKNASGLKTRIVVSHMVYSGKVTSTNGTKHGDAVIAFGGREYTYSKKSALYKTVDYIKQGYTYTVYLDYMRRIAGFKRTVDEEMQYGYMVKAGIYDNSDGEDRLWLTVYPYSGKMQKLAAADSCRIDGNSCKGDINQLNALQRSVNVMNNKMRELNPSFIKLDTYNGMLYVRYPVMYRLNSDGEVIYLDTPLETENETDDEDTTKKFGKNTMSLYEDFSDSSNNPGGLYHRNTMSFNGDAGHVVSVREGTKLFIVPKDTADNPDSADISEYVSRLNNDENYSTGINTYFKDWHKYPYQTGSRLDAYNVAENRNAAVMVYSMDVDAIEEIDQSVPLTVVDRIETAVNEDDEQVTRIHGFQGSMEVDVDLAEGVSLSKQFNGPGGRPVTSTVKKGDIIRYVTNFKGELVDYVKIFSLRDEDDPRYVVKGNEYGTANVNPDELNKTLLAVSDGRYSENGHNTPHIYNALKDYKYGSVFRCVYGTVLYRNGTNLVLKTTIDSAFGQIENLEICDLLNYNVICIDEEQEKVYVPTDDEIISSDFAGEEDATKVILHTRGGTQKELIIVKRAK